MVLFGLDTHTLIEWYVRRLSCRRAVISPESRGLVCRYNGRLNDPSADVDGAPPEATPEVILKVLQHRDDTLAQDSARAGRIARAPGSLCGA